MSGRLAIASLLSLIALLAQSIPLDLSDLSYAEEAKGLETVRGSACYGFGDDQTPAQARRGAMIKAQEEAVRNYGVYIQSSKRIKNFQLEEDIIHSISAGMLQDIRIEKEERKLREICITLSGKLVPIPAEDLIKQRLAAKEIAVEAQKVPVPPKPKFGLKVWTNKADGRFIEGDRLIIYVQPERDAYLKLDYFQADGTVTHLVPNMFRGQAFINAGKTYAFGDEASPERFVIQEPYGAEVIKAMAAIRPFDMTTEGCKEMSDGRTYLNQLRTCRGIKVVAAASTAELHTESRTVAEYKKDLPKSRSLPQASEP